MHTLILERTAESVVEKAKSIIIEKLADAIQTRGSASLVVSGGQSPLPLFEQLNRELLPWEKITVTLADERWVDFNHENSTERMVHSHLLKHRAESANFIPLKNDASTPKQGARIAEQALKVLPAHLDVVILGMGMDGHTLSWFPDAPQLESLMNPSGKNRCGDAMSPSAPHPRLSLTYAWIQQSRNILMFLSSEEKTRRFQDIVSDADCKLPVARLANDPNVQLTVIGVESNVKT